jgi:hypothetical protein
VTFFNQEKTGVNAGVEYPKFKVNTFINLDLDQLAADIMEIVDIAQVVTLFRFKIFKRYNNYPRDWSNTNGFFLILNHFRNRLHFI